MLLVIDTDLAVVIKLCPELAREMIVKDIAPRCEKTIRGNFLTGRKGDVSKMTAVVLDMHDLLDVHRHLVFTQPMFVRLIPAWNLAIR